MTIEILCNNRIECRVLHGKVRQVLSDLNLKADVVSCSVNQASAQSIAGITGLVLDGFCIPTRQHISIEDLKAVIERQTNH
ncbi:MAG: hypothetical protein C0616_06680 [Desulfuromonas sp.]|nr:MAG: hypothetical protein C0616_06680 [Desulfuromonas sp.]